MRIIGGTAAGLILKSPKGLTVRPTPDLVRQALAHPRGLAFGGGSLWINRYPQPAKIE